MNDSTKIKKLNHQKRMLMVNYEIASEELDEHFNSELQKIENKLFDLQKIGFKFKKNGNK